jgi:hypothetical protein
MCCGCNEIITPPSSIPPLITPCNECEEKIEDVCIKYTGPNLFCLGIHTNDTLDVIFNKIENALCELISCCENSYYADYGYYDYDFYGYGFNGIGTQHL